MYYGKYDDDAVLGEFYYNLDPLVYKEDPDFIIEATMEKEHRCLISIEFYGRDRIDPKTLKKKYFLILLEHISLIC